MKRFALLTSVLIFGVFASTMSSADIYRDCEAAVERGENVNVQRLAATIMRFNSIPAHKQTAANICVSVSMGQEMAYNSGGFIPLAEFEEINSEAIAARAAQEEVKKAAAEAVRVRVCELRDIVAETNKTLQEAEAAQQDRRIETLAATIQECSIWFEDDARGALTNDVCNSIFASGGLPNSVISGPTTSEALLAGRTNTNAETELAVLVESGMLLSTIAAKALEMGIFDGGDPYGCDE